jgi:hypothetical protein
MSRDYLKQSFWPEYPVISPRLRFSQCMKCASFVLRWRKSRHLLLRTVIFRILAKCAIAPERSEFGAQLYQALSAVALKTGPMVSSGCERIMTPSLNSLSNGIEPEITGRSEIGGLQNKKAYI